MYSLAHALNQNGDTAAAHSMFLETVPRQVAVAGPETHMVAYALSGQGLFLESVNAPELARPILEESERIFRTVFDEPHADQVATWIGLAYLAINDGDYVAARDLLQRALTIRTAANGPDSPSTLRAQTALARLEFERGDYDTAESILSEILATYAKGADAEHPFAVEAMTWLGRTRLRQGNAAAAVSVLEQALKLGLHRSSAGHVENVQRRLWLAEARVALGQSDARDELQRARNELATIEAEWKTMLAELPVPTIEELLDDDAA
jgi:tetratricopeptide (TPR) repeat protein